VLRAIRIVADHIKAAVFIIGDEKGVSPSNTGQGYIVRRLLRRAIRYGRNLGINQNLWTKEVARVVISDYQKTYPELIRNQAFIEDNFDKEEEKFNNTLENGLKEFNKISGDIDGVTAFNLYQSYGFPVEITEELAKEKGAKVDLAGFNVELTKHQGIISNRFGW
jgi:Alanyl-tRNA synthetase